MAEGSATGRESRLRTAVITYFPMFIATLSLLTSIYNGYLNGRFVDLIARNFGRGEYTRTCKELIEVHFQTKLRVGLLLNAAQGAEPQGTPAASAFALEAANAVSKIGALGSYLANFQDEATRVRYTDFTNELERIVVAARRAAPDEAGKLFARADHLFSEMNDSCVRLARSAPL
jgi:hypothetical protein